MPAGTGMMEPEDDRKRRSVTMAPVTVREAA
jgi:hypothetical protein